MSCSTLVALLLMPVTFYLLWRTGGAALRSSGDAGAAESLGVGVYRIRYLAVTVSASSPASAGRGW